MAGPTLGFAGAVGIVAAMRQAEPTADLNPAHYSLMQRTGTTDQIEFCADGRPVPVPTTWESMPGIPVETVEGPRHRFASMKDLEQMYAQGQYIEVPYRPVPEELCTRFAVDLTEVAALTVGIRHQNDPGHP